MRYRIKFVLCILVALGLPWVAYLFLSDDLPANTVLIKIIVVGGGLSITNMFGSLCECFLKNSVTARPEFPDLRDFPDAGGGGKETGTLERILFFVSFLRAAHTIAASWLVFKAAAKWAAWQHVAKISDADENVTLTDRIRLSSRLLGRFVNGTLFNGLCAFTGVICTKFAGYFIEDKLLYMRPEPLWLITLIVIAVVIALVNLSLFCGWPSFCADRAFAEAEYDRLGRRMDELAEKYQRTTDGKVLDEFWQFSAKRSSMVRGRK